MRPVSFINVNDKLSFKFKAFPLSKKLSNQGIINDILIFPAFFFMPFKNRILVYVKDHVPELLNKKDCKHILIIDDFFATRSNIESKSICRLSFDGFIFPNQQSLEDYGKYCSKNSLKIVIHNHIDFRHKKTCHDNFRIGYIGRKDNLNHNLVPCVKDWFSDSRNFNCHYSIRKYRDSKYKPCSKLATAVGCDANIIMTRDRSFIELLPDYEFYTGYEKKEVKRCIKYAEENFGKELWWKALEKIRSLKQKLDFENISKQYLDFFERLS